MQKRTYINELSGKKQETVIVYSWVNVRRDQGKMIFMDFRDTSGVVQGVILPSSNAMEVGKTLREEFVVEVTGKVNVEKLWKKLLKRKFCLLLSSLF